MQRRNFLTQAAGLVLSAPPWAARGSAQPLPAPSPPVTLLSAPIEVGGDWGRSLPRSALLVVTRMRTASLAGVPLVSDRQPETLRVDNHAAGGPSIWLHSDPPHQAWVIVAVGERDWSRLAYQFGHELGHVLANSWLNEPVPPPPCRWLEEALVEAFSIRGLGLLAASWERDPPFAGDNAFSRWIRNYRDGVIEQYRKVGGPATGETLAEWFKAARATLDVARGLDPSSGPAILAIADLLDRDASCVGDIGALNRWQGRSALPIAEYLAAWSRSCRELGAGGRLPAEIGSMLGLRRSLR